MLRKILVVLAWGLAVLAVVLGTILLVAYGTGYSYDFKTNRLVRNGLVILESKPDGAKLAIDGQDPRRKTPFRRTFEQGVHNFTLNLPGYRTWSKDITVVASEVSLVQYVLLFEEQLKLEPVNTYPHINIFTPDRERRKIAYNVTSGADLGLWAINTANNEKVKLYTPRAATPEKPAETISEVTWSDDGSHLLLKTNVDKVNWLVVSDNGRDSVINVSQNTGFDFPTLKFNPENWRELYWLSSEGLRRINVTDNNISGVLVNQVIDFGFADDRIVYVDGSKPQRTLWALERGGRKIELDSRLPLAERYQITSGRFRGIEKVAVLPISTGKALLFDDAFGLNYGPNNVLDGVTRIEFTSNGHFLAGFSDNTISTYDIEKHKPWQFAGKTPIKFASWVDDFHLIYDRDGQITVSEYDSQNTTKLVPSSPLPSWSSSDGKHIYYVAQLPAGHHQIKTIRIRQ